MCRYIFLSVIFIFLAINLSYSNTPLSIPKKSLDLNFTGKVKLHLPFDLNKLDLKGELNIANIKLKGDFYVKIINRNPIIGIITSNYIKLDINEFTTILNKFGIKTSIPKDIKGNVVLEGINLKLKGNSYSLQIDKITGPTIYDKDLLLANFDIKGDIKKQEFNINIKKIVLDAIKINNLIIENKEKIISISCNNGYLDLYYIKNLAFKLVPNLNKKIISIIKENNIYFPKISDIDLKGNIKLKKFKLSLAKNKEKLTLLQINCNISSKDTSIILNNEKKLPTTLSLASNSIDILYQNGSCNVEANNVNLNFKNIYLKNKLDNIKTYYFYVRDINLDVGFKSKIKTGNSTKISFNLHVIPKNNLILNVDKKSNLVVNISPFDIEMQDNTVTLANNKYINLDLKNILAYLSKNKILKLSGQIKLNNNNFMINLEKRYLDLKSNVVMSNSNIDLKNFNIKISNFTFNVKSDKNILDLTNGYLRAKLNQKGDILLHFNTSIPFTNFNSKLKEIYKNTILNLQVKDTAISNNKIKNLSVKKESSYLTRLNYNIELKSLKLTGDTSINLNPNKVDIITRKLLLIDTSKKIKEDNRKNHNDNTPIKIEVPDIIKNLSSKYHFEFDLIEYRKKETEYFISSLKSDVLLKDHPVIGLNGYFCNMLVSGGGEYKNGEIYATIDIRAISLPIDHLIACFTSRAPIYITGDTNFQGTVNTQGKTIKELKNHFSFDALVDIDNGRIMKLSNLGKKIKWILNVLSYVKLNPSKLEDSLDFEKIIVSLSGGLSKIDIKQIKVYSPMLNLYSYGKVNLDKNEMELSGLIKKGFLSKKFHFKEKISKNKD